MSFYKGNKKIAGLYVDHDVEHATEEHAGIIEIAKQSEVAEGVIDSKAITPKKLKTITDTKQDVISDLSDIRTNAQTGAELAPQVAVNTQRIEELTISKFPNVVVVGTPHIEGGQVSNFSDSNYLQFPFIDISRGLPFDIYFSFTTSADITTQQNILDSYFGIALAIQNGKGIMALSSNGTNWDIGTSIGTNNLLPNTTYYVKYSWTGTAYSASLSTDDQTYIPDMNLTSSLSPHKTTIFIGGSPNLFGTSSAHPFKGTINFNKSKVVVNNIVVWEGMADVGLASRANVSLNNLDEVGEKRFSDKQDKLIAGQNITIDESTNTISATGGGVIPDNAFTSDNLKGGKGIEIVQSSVSQKIAYNFGKLTNYVQVPINTTTDGLEISFSFETGDTIDSYSRFQYIFGKENVLDLSIRQGKIAVDIGDGYNWISTVNYGTTLIETNKKYYIKYIFTSSNLQVKLSQNGADYTTEVSIPTSNYSWNTMLNFGTIAINNYDLIAFEGKIWISDLVISKNGNVLYNGATDEYTLVGNPSIDIIGGTGEYVINSTLDVDALATKEYVDNIVGNIETQLSEI